MAQNNNTLVWPSGELDFSPGCLVMGILNVTPDSFSDGGRYLDIDAAVTHGLQMVSDGAAILDLGAESTRPQSEPVPPDQQIARAIPVIKALRQSTSVPISIDTTLPEVARAAIEAGASIINDISASSTGEMAALAAQLQVPLILMHMQGTPKIMQLRPVYDNILDDVLKFLLDRAAAAVRQGVPMDRIFIDPGIGFGKTIEHNLILLKHLDEFVRTSYRVLLGTSRKRFIGDLTGRHNPAERTFGTAATVALAAWQKVSIVRVHDVKEMVEVINVVNAIRASI